MDLDSFNQVVEQFNTVYPPEHDGLSGMIEEMGETTKEVSVGDKERAAHEWADALFVWLAYAYYHKFDIPKALTEVAAKNHKKMVEKSLVKGANGKWIKAEDAAKIAN